MKKAGVNILFLLLFSLAIADNFSSEKSNFYPLGLGNIWNYRLESFGLIALVQEEVIDTAHLNTRSYMIKKIVSRNNKTNELIRISFDTLRENSDGKLYRYSKVEDKLAYDFGLQSGETFNFKLDGWEYIVSSEYAVKTVTAGEFDSCIKFFFDDTTWNNDEQTAFFAPGAGLVYWEAEWHAQKELLSAVIDGNYIDPVGIKKMGNYHLTISNKKQLPKMEIVVSNRKNGNNLRKYFSFNLLGRKIGRIDTRGLQRNVSSAKGIYIPVLNGINQ